jgi:hypothetical protein
VAAVTAVLIIVQRCNSAVLVEVALMSMLMLESLHKSGLVLSFIPFAVLHADCIWQACHMYLHISPPVRKNQSWFYLADRNTQGTMHNTNHAHSPELLSSGTVLSTQL